MKVPEQWPAAMRTELAARYVGVSRATFLKGMHEGIYPQSRCVSPNCRVWRRKDLDDCIDAAFGEAGSSKADWMRRSDEVFGRTAGSATER